VPIIIVLVIVVIVAMIVGIKYRKRTDAVELAANQKATAFSNPLCKLVPNQRYILENFMCDACGFGHDVHIIILPPYPLFVLLFV
jgi:hypothetical protein